MSIRQRKNITTCYSTESTKTKCITKKRISLCRRIFIQRLSNVSIIDIVRSIRIFRNAPQILYDIINSLILARKFTRSNITFARWNIRIIILFFARQQIISCSVSHQIIPLCLISRSTHSKRYFGKIINSIELELGSVTCRIGIVPITNFISIIQRYKNIFLTSKFFCFCLEIRPRTIRLISKVCSAFTNCNLLRTIIIFSPT